MNENINARWAKVVEQVWGSERKTYQIYYHGKSVGTIEATSENVAISVFYYNNRQYNSYGLTAFEIPLN